MGEIVGMVSQTRGGSFEALTGLPSVRQAPNQNAQYAATKANGTAIGSGYDSARSAQLAVENTVGYKLQWQIDNSTGTPRYTGRSPYIFPGDLPLVGGLWLRADRGVTVVARSTDVGERFTQRWASLDGTPGRAATQMTAADQPTRTTESLNGQPAVIFDDGTTEFMTTNALGAMGAPLTAFHMLRYQDAGRQQVVIQSDGLYQVRVSGAGVLEVVVGASTFNGGAVNDGEVFLVSVIMSSTGAQIFRDGVLLGSVATVAAAGDWTVSDPVNAWAGAQAEHLVVPQELSRRVHDQLVTSYFNRRYRFL